MTEMLVPSRVNEAFHTLQRELNSLKQSNGLLRRHNEKLRDHRDRLERRLTGALYELYGDWDRVNRELPRA